MFTWEADMSVGVKELDDHHKRLFDLINKLESSLAQGDGVQTTREVLAEVANYTIYHFFAEEDLMERHGYPDHASHREEHLALIARTMELIAKAQDGKAGIGGEVFDFLGSWLKKHVLVVDKQYTDFFQGKGVS